MSQEKFDFLKKIKIWNYFWYCSAAIDCATAVSSVTPSYKSINTSRAFILWASC